MTVFSPSLLKIGIISKKIVTLNIFVRKDLVNTDWYHLAHIFRQQKYNLDSNWNGCNQSIGHQPKKQKKKKKE